MSVLLDAGSSEFLYYGTAVLAGAPFTMACKAKLTTANGQHHGILSLADYDLDDNYIVLGVLAPDHGSFPNEVIAGSKDSFNWKYSNSGASISNQVWFHAAAVYASASSRYAYLNGVPGAEETTSITPVGMDITGIGVVLRNTKMWYASGDIAEVAFWNVALTTPEIKSLSKGFSPLLIRPASLVAYWPLIREGASGVYRDIVGGRVTTEAGGSATSPHPPVIYPSPMIPGQESISGRIYRRPIYRGVGIGVYR